MHLSAIDSLVDRGHQYVILAVAETEIRLSR
jgi:hypothetical protein